MSLKEMLLGGGGLLIVLLTMVEIAPIKFNPWSALAKGIGRAINAEMLNELRAVKSELADLIRKDDERNAVHAIANISRVYDDRLREHDFLKSSSNERDEDTPDV